VPPPHAFACLIVIVVSIGAFTVPRFGVPDMRPSFNPSPLLVDASSEVVQSFRVRADGLTQILVRVLQSSSAAAVDATIGYRTQGGMITVLRKTTVGVAQSDDPRYVRIEFPPLQTAADAEFALALRVRSSVPTAQVTLQTAEGHEYREGSLWVNGEPVPADLVMRVDARFAQPWRAFARRLRRQTGLPGLEWLFAVCYLGAICGLLRGLDALRIET
jgi:hypothetical protein